MKNQIMIDINHVSKQYKLGAIGGTTLRNELQSKMAKVLGKEDPNVKIGEENFSKNEKFWALKDISFQVKKGEKIGIIGHNGAGKSTLLKLLSRITVPTEGSIGLNGRIAAMLEVGTGFHPELSGRENIYMNGAILGMTKTEIEEKMEDIIEFSEVRQFIDTPVKRYSSGMYVKLAFSVAAHLDSEIMVMDEVLAVGDMKFQQKCLGKMGDAADKDGKTVLYVSHNMNTIRQLCSRCVVLDKGRMIFDGGVDEAIEIYMEQQSNGLESVYELGNTKRPSTEHGVKFRVNRLEFCKKEKAIYRNTEKIYIKIDWVALADIENLRYYFAIVYTDDVCIGMTQSKCFASVKTGEVGTSYLEFDISNLVEGKYYFYVDVFSMNEFFSHESYDHPMKKIYFEVVKDEAVESINWIRRAWGSVRLNELQILK